MEPVRDAVLIAAGLGTRMFPASAFTPKESLPLLDGSCLGNQNVDASTPAAWGLVVVIGDSGLGKGSGELHHEEAGPVITDPQQNGFIGAEVGSNNTAELSGFAAALRWLLIEGGEDAAVIRADSTYAGNLASGSGSSPEAWRAAK